MATRKAPKLKEVPPYAHDAEPVDDPQEPFQGIETTAGQVFAGPLDDEEPGETGVTLRIVAGKSDAALTNVTFDLTGRR